MTNTERTRINKYYAKRLTARYRAKMAHTVLFKRITYTFTILAILSIALGTVQVSSEALIYSWGFPEAGAREIGVYEARMQVRQQIINIAKEENFKHTDYLIRLACCESWLGTAKDNKRGNVPATSVDRGTLMINSFWHDEVLDDCAYDLDCATRWTMDRINKGYQKEWMCDAHVRGVKDYTLTHCGI